MCTRWDSKIDMIERIIEQDAICVALGRSHTWYQASWQDFHVLQSVLEAVRGFKDLIKPVIW